MNKTFYRIGMLAAAAMAFVACNKEVEINNPEEETHVAIISIGKAIETRTAVVEGETEASYKWLDDDAQYLHVYENNTAGTITKFSLNGDKTIATLTVEFTGTPTAPYSYTAKYAKTLSNSNNPLIPNEQNPSTTSFDPAADILVSKATSDVTNLEERATEFTFTMGRVVTVNKMTLTGLEEGEVVSSVEFSLDKHMAGYVSYDSANNNYSYSSGGMTLTLKYTPSNGVVPASGEFPVYFVSAPVDAASIVSVVVTTDKNVYTKANTLDPNPFEGKTISFSIGTMKRFTMAMSGYGEEITEGTVYTLVEKVDDIFSGAKYIITAADVDKAIQSYTSGNNHKAVDIEKNTTNKTVTIDNTIDAEEFIITGVEGGYTIQNALNKNYLNSNTSNNRLTESSSSETFTITISNGVATIVSKSNTNRGYMYYNGTAGTNGNIFSCYADKSSDESGNYHLLALYVDQTTCVELADPELSFNVVDLIEVNWDDTENFTAPTLNNPHDLSVSYSSSEPAVATVDAASGEIVFVGNGETTITAKSAKTSDYKAGEASYTLSVSGKVDFKSIAELNALATTTATMWDGRLENAIVSFVPDRNSAVIKDETGSILVYIYDKNDSEKVHGLKQGQTFSGYFMPTVKLYNGTAEIIDLDEAIFEGEGAVVEPVSFTLATLVGNLTKYQNAYVQVTGLSVTNVSGQNLSVSNGDYSYMVYVPKNCPIVAGDIITVTGTVAHYGDNDQIKVWNLDDIEKTGHVIVTPSITFSQPSQGGSFTVVVDGAEITSGAAVQEGKTVSLTATAADGYTFNGWTVTGATLSGNTATETFIVGTTDVTIAAAFKSNSSPSLDPEEIDFTAQGYTNQQEISSASAGHFSVSFNKGTNSNVPKYYTNGTAIRAYGGNYFTVSSEYTISKIEITFGSDDGSNAITTDVVTYENGTWTGSANSVVFTIGGTTGNRRIRKIKVTY